MAVQPRIDLHQTTVEAFEAFIALPENADRHFELIDGEIVEKPMPTQEHGRIVMRFGSRLHVFVEDHNLGYVEVEVRYRTSDDDTNTRQPDLSFFAEPNTPAIKRGPVMRLPDLALEVKSPDDTFIKMREKAIYYLKNGTRLVLLLFPDRQQIEIHTSDNPVRTLGIEDTLDGGDVLPGFTIAVKDIFPK